MTNQEEGLKVLGLIARRVIPPKLEALILVYRPESPGTSMSSVAVMVDGSVKFGAGGLLERGRAAAVAFINLPPTENYDPNP